MLSGWRPGREEPVPLHGRLGVCVLIASQAEGSEGGNHSQPSPREGWKTQLEDRKQLASEAETHLGRDSKGVQEALHVLPKKRLAGWVPLGR